MPAVVALSGPEERAQAGQDRLLARYLRRQVQPYSRLHRDELRAAAGDGRVLLARVLPRRLHEIGDPGLALLRPDARSITESGDLPLVARLWWAQLLRRQEALNRTLLEPVYKPVHWVVTDGVPVGYSAEDLERLAELGRAGLEHAGIQRTDSIVTLDQDAASVIHAQLTLGARRAGVAAVHAGDAARAEALVAHLAPTVVAGPADSLRAVAARSPRLRLSIVTDGPLGPEASADLAAAVGPIVEMWAPPGARAAWLSCPARAFHTWPATEIVERHPETGSLLWSPIQWKGTVVLRADTGVMGTIEAGPCPACGRASPRVVPEPALPEPAPARRPAARSPRRR